MPQVLADLCQCGAHALMSKEFAPEVVVARDNMDHTRLVIKNDRAPAMRALAGRVEKLTTLNKAEYEPQSNGLAKCS